MFRGKQENDLSYLEYNMYLYMYSSILVCACVCTHTAVGIPSACPTSQTAHIA